MVESNQNAVVVSGARIKKEKIADLKMTKEAANMKLTNREAKILLRNRARSLPMYRAPIKRLMLESSVKFITPEGMQDANTLGIYIFGAPSYDGRIHPIVEDGKVAIFINKETDDVKAFVHILLKRPIDKVEIDYLRNYIKRGE
jgi:hypothetical protein